MKLQEFIASITDKVSGILGDGFTLSSKKVLKNNSIEFECLIVSQENNCISPSIYLNNYYLEYLSGRSLEDLAEEIVSFYWYCLNQIPGNACQYLDTENAVDKVVMRLVSYTQNKKYLENCPYTRVEDLAITYHYVVTNDDENGLSTVKIDYENMKFFNIDEAEMRRKALDNTERLFPAVFEKVEYLVKKFLEDKLGVQPAEDYWNHHGVSMYVITTKTRLNGAVCILYKGMLERIRKTLDSDFFIIPSSINEIILVPDVGITDRETLDEMLRFVNKEEVPSIEVLSDHIYHYPENQFELTSDPSVG